LRWGCAEGSFRQKFQRVQPREIVRDANGAACRAPTEQHNIIWQADSRTGTAAFRRRAAAPPGCGLFLTLIIYRPSPSLPLGAVSPDLTGLTVIGSDGVEICCLVIEGRETHRSLACDFHAVAFALRLVVSAFADRERDLPRRKCVAANDQNFPGFVTPHDMRIHARNAETLARRRWHVCQRRNTSREQSGPTQPRNTQFDQFWSSFPGMPNPQAGKRETNQKKHKHGSDSGNELEHGTDASGRTRSCPYSDFRG
jgi:hypothetical protein